MFKYYLRIHFIVIVLIWTTSSLLAQFTPPPGSPLANHEHPRLFFTDSMLQNIATYVDTFEVSNFQTFISILDGLYNNSPSSKTRNYLLLDTKNYAFLSCAVHSGYFSDNDLFTFTYTADQYAQKAYDHAMEIKNRVMTEYIEDNHNSQNFKSDDEGGYVNLAIAVAYDWCYNYLTQTEKENLVNFMIYQYDNRNDDVYPGGKTKLDNNRIAYAHAGASGGLAIWGDSLEIAIESKVQNMLDMIQEIWIDRIWKMGDHAFENTTGWGEGPGYFFLSCKSAIWFTAAASSALGQNLFKEYKWLHNVPLFLWFSKFPMSINGEWHDYFFHRYDDGDLAQWESSLELIICLANQLKSIDPDSAGFYRWMLEDSKYPISENSLSDTRLFGLFYNFLWGIKDITKKDYKQLDIKNSYKFGLGNNIFQSAQNDYAATQVQFFTPKYYQRSHAHSDHSSINIWKYGTLLLDAWNKKNGFDLPKASLHTGQPISHNLLALYPSGGGTEYPHAPDINEGADAYYDSDNQPGGANNIGNVLAIDLEGENYDYVDYDYTRCYKGVNFVNFIRRAVIYIRDPNTPNYKDEEYVVVFDQIDVTDPTIKKRWLGHFAFMPENVNGLWNKVSPGFWTDTTGSILKISNTYANAHGRMFLKVLSPENYQLRLRGGNEGDNYYWFVDAEGNDLTERGPFDDWAAFWVSSYRLEIEDQSLSNVSHYLTTMQIGDANTLNSMVPVQKIATNNFVGALINEDRVAFFNTANTPQTSISYVLNSNKTVKHVLTGLLQGTYNLEVNGNTIPGINTTVDEDGVLYFEYNGGGEFHLQHSSVKISDDQSSIIDYNIQQNYPNPFNPKTTINYQLPETSQVRLEIFNVLGQKTRTLVDKKMERGQHQTLWDGLDDDGAPVTSGIYLCRFETDNFQETIKMLLMK
jgi:hypothetical protein